MHTYTGNAGGVPCEFFIFSSTGCHKVLTALALTVARSLPSALVHFGSLVGLSRKKWRNPKQSVGPCNAGEGSVFLHRTNSLSRNPNTPG